MIGEDASEPGPEGSPCYAADGNILGDQNVAEPFQFLIKFPNFEDEKLRGQVRDAKLLVGQEHFQRDAIRGAIKKKRLYIQALYNKFVAAVSEKKDATRSIHLKRQEIDSLLGVLNRMKNTILILETNNRIQHLEQVVEHETLSLEEEKVINRNIKLVKQLRDQLSSNMASRDEVQVALDQRHHTERRLHLLKKELDSLKAKDLRATKVVFWLGKKYDDEMIKLRELHVQFKAANGILQETTTHLKDLKEKLRERFNHFARYKDDYMEASECALRGDKEALKSLCHNQMETVMEQWNRNDEFRKDYLRCNMKSTVRRLKTLDGRSVGPGEESPVLPNYVDETLDQHLSNSFKATSQQLVLPLDQGKIVEQENVAEQEKPLEQEKDVKHEKTLTIVKGEVAASKSMEAAETNQALKRTTVSKSNLIPDMSGLETVSCNFEAVETIVDETEADEIVKMEEELELARKAEMQRQEELAAQQKEQRRLEEKAKAQEALERKKRIAEKAQLRAELRAQKEAEQKEREREKRLRKKERNSTDGEITSSPEECENNDVHATVTKPKKMVRYTKQIKKIEALPPALRNRGRKRLKQIMWWTFGALIVFFVFLVASGGAFGNLKLRRDDSIFGKTPPLS